jgi:hypothetical protein
MFGQTYLPAADSSLTATFSALQQQQQQQQQQQHTQQPYQPLLYSHHQPAPADVANAADVGRLDSESAVAAAAAAALSSDEEECINEELCVVCWVGQRSVALVHGADAHLVSNTAIAAASVEPKLAVAFWHVLRSVVGSDACGSGARRRCTPGEQQHLQNQQQRWGTKTLLSCLVLPANYCSRCT